MKDEIKKLFPIEFYIKKDKMYAEVSLENLNKIVDYITNLQEKVNQYENPDDMTLMFMWCDEKAKDKIKQLQEENERLKELNENASKVCIAEHKYGVEKAEEARDYKSRNEKAIEDIDLVIELIKQQPTEDDTWILNRLNGFKYILQGSDKDE